jgi:hypothetical protein
MDPRESLRVPSVEILKRRPLVLGSKGEQACGLRHVKKAMSGC